MPSLGKEALTPQIGVLAAPEAFTIQTVFRGNSPWGPSGCSHSVLPWCSIGCRLDQSELRRRNGKELGLGTFWERMMNRDNIHAYFIPNVNQASFLLKSFAVEVLLININDSIPCNYVSLCYYILYIYQKFITIYYASINLRYSTILRDFAPHWPPFSHCASGIDGLEKVAQLRSWHLRTVRGILRARFWTSWIQWMQNFANVQTIDSKI